MPDRIEPVLATGPLLIIAALAIAVLLFLIIKVKLHAFVALVLVSLLVAVATRIPVEELVRTLTSGFGATLATVALLVGLGAMLGRLLEVSGGAQVLADKLIAVFGEKRAPLGLGVAALLFGFPIFFDAGLIVFLPIVFTVAARLGGGILRYALPVAGAFAVMHAFVPPHPGPVAASELIGANIGLTLLVGLVIGLPTWFIASYLFGTWMGNRLVLPVPDTLGEIEEASAKTGTPTDLGEGQGTGGTGRPDDLGGGSGGGGAAGGGGRLFHRRSHSDRDSGGSGGAAPTIAGTSPTTGDKTPLRPEPGSSEVVREIDPERKTVTVIAPPPSFGIVLLVLLIPLVLIFLNTGVSTLVTSGALSEESVFVQTAQVIGATPIALLISVLAAMWLLGWRRHKTGAEVESIANSALGPVCAIILITGAGGMFGAVLRASGIGTALSDVLANTGLPVIVAAFVIATCLRVAQGSATVALVTTAGLIAPVIAATEGLSSVDLSLIVIAIACGSTVLSHVNDSGFWLVGRFLAMDEKTTLKTWTVMETLIGTVGFIIALGASLIF